MSTQQHILLYTDDPGIYGVGQHNHALLCRLHQDGHPVTCVQTEQNNPLRGLSIAQLEQLGEVLLDFSSLTDVASWLERSA
jgi:hypothetical protein